MSIIFKTLLMGEGLGEGVGRTHQLNATPTVYNQNINLSNRSFHCKSRRASFPTVHERENTGGRYRTSEFSGVTRKI